MSVLLPDWPPGTVTFLATGGDGGPHVIPVSAVLRAGDARIVLALAPRRESLRRLRAEPRVALVVLAAGNVALTAEGRAEVVGEPLPGAENVVGVELAVERVQEHGNRHFEITDGVQWHWSDEESEARDVAVRSALAALASRP
ncbi:MAG: pyridoxamine 5'-phosphate oxidase family protein [Solirubrobacterales bacterium]|nr:pyridoxamine 5'-phosphate oxidase family protein [Solirubrobacterales bacterium]